MASTLHLITTNQFPMKDQKYTLKEFKLDSFVTAYIHGGQINLKNADMIELEAYAVKPKLKLSSSC